MFKLFECSPTKLGGEKKQKKRSSARVYLESAGLTASTCPELSAEPGPGEMDRLRGATGASGGCYSQLAISGSVRAMLLPLAPEMFCVRPDAAPWADTSPYM